MVNTQITPAAILVESHYLPPLSAFVMMQSFSQILIDINGPFRKSTLRNRTRIGGANGVILLTIPVAGGRNVRKAMKDVRIDYREPWQRIHWGSIFSAYGRSGYFMFYEDKFAPFYQQKFEFLIDFNTALLEVCLGMVNMNLKVIKTNPSAGNVTTEVFDSRNKLLNIENLIRYRQVFEDRNGFIPNLSIIDLIFNMGPDAGTLIKAAS